MSNQIKEAPTRGLTTLQLLHIAAQIAQNMIWVEGGRTNKVSSVGDELANAFQIPMPQGTRVNIKKALTKAGWFAPGRGDNAFRALTDEGRMIEAARPRILQFVRDNFDQWMTPAAFQPTRDPRSTRDGPNTARSVAEALSTTGVKFYSTKDVDFNGRIAALRAALDITGPTEPGPPIIASGGAVGRTRPADPVEAQSAINASNGFRSQRLADYLATRVTLPTSGQRSPQEVAARNRLRDLLHNATNADNPSAKKSEIRAMGSRPQMLHQFVMRLSAAAGGDAQLGALLWQAASQSAIGNLLSSYDIAKPTGMYKGQKTRDWLHDAKAQANSDPNDAYGYTRAIFEALLARYLEAGAAGDDAAYVQKSSRRRESSRPEGLLGPADSSLVGLSMANPKKVALFTRKASQGKYSIPGLKKGALLLGIRGVEDALVHDFVIGAIKDAVVRKYADEVDANSQPHIDAVSAALGLNGANKTKAGILAKLDALYGTKPNADCAGLTKEDEKRIAKAHGISAEAVDRDGCGALAGVPVEPSVSVSSRRREIEAAPVSRSKSKSTTGASTGILMKMMRGGGVDISPPSQPLSALEGLSGMPSPGRQSGGLTGLTGLTSPRRQSGGLASPGRQSGGLASPRQSGGLASPRRASALSSPRRSNAPSDLNDLLDEFE